jgi:Kinesin motor domain
MLPKQGSASEPSTDKPYSDEPNHHRRHETRVKVGVRIRPLTSLEIQQGGKSSLTVDSPSIQMGKRQFTYDAVFDSSCGQADLYDTVSSPLLSSFIDGYNATVSRILRELVSVLNLFCHLSREQS